MKMLLKNISIRNKLLSMLVLPMLSVIGFSSVIVFQKYREFSITNQLIADSNFFAEIGAVVHDLQKERGSTVTFVSSHGAKMADKVPLLRQDSDKSINVLIPDIQARIKKNKHFESVQTQLTKLVELRQQANQFSIDGLKVAAQYTAIIQSLLELTNTVGKTVHNDVIMRGANTYSAYMNMKERAGRERAMLSGVFAMNKMPMTNFLKISTNLGEYNVSFNQFNQIATSEQIEFHQKTVFGKVIEEVDALRKLALESPLETPLNVDSNHWFDLATQRINAMKKVEDKLGDDLKLSAENIRNEAQTALIISSICTLIVFMATAVLVHFITKAITHPLTLMKNVIVDVNRTGDFSKKIDYQSRDELGETAQAFNDMLTTLQVALHETSLVMEAIENGDFQVRIRSNMDGDLNRLKTTVNATVNELSSTISALNQAMIALRNGDFSKRIETHVKGEFQQAVENAKNAERAMHEMFADIGRVMERIAVGDISHRVEVEGRGELAKLKENINSTIDALDSLNNIVYLANALAQGDLTQSINKIYPGIFGEVTNSINHTTLNLKNLVGQIYNLSMTINKVAKEISAGNNNLSHRTEEQAASLEETAASMQELTSTVEQNSNHASNVNQLASKASDIAMHGVSVVDSVVKTMEDINQSSHKIVDIISVIDDIAFQTNILALNAAVEAARAGEQGKGFAVVAVEVRNLAQRAGNAAGEIKRLISDSVEKVTNGSALVYNAGTTMEEIVDSIRNVTSIVSEITSASVEQTVGISQINQAIKQMDNVTQQNATLVEQATRAIQSLEDQTNDLASSLQAFRV